MKETLHGLAGGITLWGGVALVGLGLSIYWFRIIRGKVSVDRSLLVELHRLLAYVLVATLVVHIIARPDDNVFLFTGAGLLILMPILGLWMRVRKSKFKEIGRIKIAVLAVSAVLLFAGHWIADEFEQDEESKTMQIESGQAGSHDEGAERSGESDDD